ncbi:glycosyltransferase family 2 protein [Algoriphagus limi]|uniref:Glycosyltransferase n=1 Tax=Algoriphagus limi TaxID=2975273 RepID=A0ABT2G4R6_9BACT|nr:glycosyltransferase family 2 protein [Algoriphagus limi]MCS5489025.1 glycosyltransferase [Algoriphagus limi]
MSCSIIICTYNGETKLQKTLKAIINQETAFPWELILIDNNSSDNTFPYSESFLENSGIDYRVERYLKPGKMYAFWFGMSLAKYDFILDCDDDNELFPDFLEEGLKILNSKPKVGALGSLGILPEQKVPDWFIFFSKSYALGPQRNHLEPLPKFAHLYGAGCFYRKSILDDLKKKGFESLLSCRKGEELTSGGDVELCHAIQLMGYDLMYSESSKFYHHIGEERINFEYYLRLKKGISSSFPILLAYQFDEYSNFSDFKKALLSSFIILIKGLIKTFILPRNTYQRKVDFVVVRAKFWAFFKNYRTAIDGYKRNQKIFGS